MREIKFHPSKQSCEEAVDWWTYFLDESEAATVAVIEAWENWLEKWITNPDDVSLIPNSGGKRGNKSEPRFDFAFRQPLWTELKVWLNANVFHNKCAYCETELFADRYGGDAEHFRPKGNVRFENDEEILIKVPVKLWDNLVIDHPGYFWLAYNWKNLMPACSSCNSRAKVDQFPTESDCLLMVELSEEQAIAAGENARPSRRFKGYYYLAPPELDIRERPFLLCPLNPLEAKSPRMHLKFGVAGRVRPVEGSDIGHHTIKVLRLDWPELDKQRQRAQERFMQDYYLARQSGCNHDELRARLGKYIKGIEPYSAAALDYFEIILEQDRMNTTMFQNP